MTELFNSLAVGKNNEDKITKFISFKLKGKESILINEAKIQTLEKDLNDAIYRYDNMFNNNIFLPGLIGNSCKFPRLIFILFDLSIYKKSNSQKKIKSPNN